VAPPPRGPERLATHAGIPRTLGNPRRDPLARRILRRDPLACRILCRDPLARRILCRDPLACRILCRDPLARRILRRDPLARGIPVTQRYFRLGPGPNGRTVFKAFQIVRRGNSVRRAGRVCPDVSSDPLTFLLVVVVDVVVVVALRSSPGNATEILKEWNVTGKKKVRPESLFTRPCGDSAAERLRTSSSSDTSLGSDGRLGSNSLPSCAAQEEKEAQARGPAPSGGRCLRGRGPPRADGGGGGQNGFHGSAPDGESLDSLSEQLDTASLDAELDSEPATSQTTGEVTSEPPHTWDHF